MSPSSCVFQFGRECSATGAQWSVEWDIRRNCSLSPRQLLLSYSVLCGLSLAVASVLWWHGARMVMPFAWLELLAVGAAMLVYARHACDHEHIALRGDRLSVDRELGSKVEHVEFVPQWVRVGGASGEQSLVELSGQGRCIAVGRFMPPQRRPQLAEELRRALRLACEGKGGRDGRTLNWIGN
jgi:uncharacterized membrane protein